MTLSKNGVRKGERVIEVSNDGTHPEGGNFVLTNGGKAAYGGAIYYREGYAPQSAVKPEPEYIFRKGDRVRVLDDDVYGSVSKGALGTVNEDFVAEDQFFGVLMDDGDDFWMFAPDEVEPYTESAPLAVGDRVVYTPPETVWGRPGVSLAAPGLTGELGTVTRAPYAGGVTVRWDNAGSLRNAVEFVQRAPEYRLVTYTSGVFGEDVRAVGIQRTSDGHVAGFMATDSPDARRRLAEYMDDSRVSTWIYSAAKRDIQPL